MSKKKIFKGAATALVTPFKNGRVDLSALSKIIELQISGGVSALVVGGTTGEAATLTDAERYGLYEYVKDKAAGRVKIIFGTGTNDTDIAVRHTKKAADIGCDAALVVTPYYNKGTYKGVTEHYKKIAASASVPIILYNVPSRTGVNLTVRQLEELAQIDNIVGIKEASDSADRLTELSKFGDELYLYAGNDTQIYSVLALGGCGVISVASNLYPEKVSEICSLFFAKKRAASLKLQQELFGFIRLMFKETNPAPIKYAMSRVKLCESEVRLPLAKPERATMRAIRNEMKKLGYGAFE